MNRKTIAGSVAGVAAVFTLGCDSVSFSYSERPRRDVVVVEPPPRHVHVVEPAPHVTVIERHPSHVHVVQPRPVREVYVVEPQPTEVHVHRPAPVYVKQVEKGKAYKVPKEAPPPQKQRDDD